LGLSVVLGIITGHGGGVEVSSIPFERTAFTIYLPHIDKPVLRAEEQHVESILQGEGRILFVEDDPDQLTTIPRVLRNLGYEVDPIGDAALAADMISEQPESWDLVITDFDMPELNGLELAQHISDTAPELPVIMVSGRNLAAKGAQEIPSVKTLVSKPYNSSIIGKAITSVLHPLQ
jgi:CheY-like chemotaxis protein